MEATKLYSRLEQDFIKKGLSDEWMNDMSGIEDYLTQNFKKRSMGLVCDFTDKIESVYTAVFPSDDVMLEVLDTGVHDAMLFVHHPVNWDISYKGSPFFPMNNELLDWFRENRISIYNLHVPLDNYSEYSTSKTLADVLSIKIDKPFCKYHGGLCGVIGTTNCKTVEELSDNLSSLVGHPTKTYLYGDSKINNGRVAVIAGGGNDMDTVREMIENDVRVLVTGVSVLNDFSKAVHDLDKEHGINVIGGTHYSTEQFAPRKMCGYFINLGLAARFVEGRPNLEDM
jgi:putative NIF3 family GTP cyclohydrolase 1 type 2